MKQTRKTTLSNTAKRIFLTVALALTTSDAAASELQLKGDLMIHPNQIAGFFAIAADKISSTESWQWPKLSFRKPYRTSWTGVEAKGPFHVQFDTTNLAQQEAGFELLWNDPQLDVASFQIRDTITRNVGGANLILHLDGACSDMSVRLVNGQWRVRGVMKWQWTNEGLQVGWKSFDFDMNQNPQTQIDLGRCKGPKGIQQALKEALKVATKDAAWMRELLRDGLLDWIEGSLGTLQSQLLTAREIPVRPGVMASWQPRQIVDAGNGVLRVDGQMNLKKAGGSTTAVIVEKGYDPQSLAHVSESGFVLPKETLAHVLGFFHANGELGYRLNSGSVNAFKSLLSNRFIQFFVWPDLMKFASNAEFYFDLKTEAAPTLGAGRVVKGEVVYDFSAPLLARQWAPTKTEYLPYIDFRAPAKGELHANVKDGQLSLQLDTQELNVQSKFLPEFQKFRAVNSRLSNSMLGSRVADYLRGNIFRMDIPAWSLSDDMSLAIRGVQPWKQSFRVPLEFKRGQP